MVVWSGDWTRCWVVCAVLCAWVKTGPICRKNLIWKRRVGQDTQSLPHETTCSLNRILEPTANSSPMPSSTWEMRIYCRRVISRKPPLKNAEIQCFLFRCEPRCWRWCRRLLAALHYWSLVSLLILLTGWDYMIDGSIVTKPDHYHLLRQNPVEFICNNTHPSKTVPLFTNLYCINRCDMMRPIQFLINCHQLN